MKFDPSLVVWVYRILKKKVNNFIGRQVVLDSDKEFFFNIGTIIF